MNQTKVWTSEELKDLNDYINLEKQNIDALIIGELFGIRSTTPEPYDGQYIFTLRTCNGQLVCPPPMVVLGQRESIEDCYFSADEELNGLEPANQFEFRKRRESV